jgi:hypothetical protein
MAKRDPEVAPLGRRLLAACIDATCILSAIAAGLAAAAFWGWREKDADGGGLAPLKRWNEWAKSPLWRCAAFAQTPVLRNWRTPGMRLMCIRRVDARTGGPVTARSALRRLAFERAWNAGVKRVTRPLFDRHVAHAKETWAKFEQHRLDHKDDPRPGGGFVFEDREAVGCCGAMLATVAIQELPISLSSRRQNLTEWVAGTVVVRD